MSKNQLSGEKFGMPHDVVEREKKIIDLLPDLRNRLIFIRDYHPITVERDFIKELLDDLAFVTGENKNVKNIYRVRAHLTQVYENSNASEERITFMPPENVIMCDAVAEINTMESNKRSAWKLEPAFQYWIN